MPNWVYTTCTVSGPEHDIATLRAKLFRDDGSIHFERVVPLPADLVAREALYDLATYDAAGQLILASCGNVQASSQPQTITTTVVKPTCASPRPNTVRRMDDSLGKENSRPIENIRNTTPSSPKVCVAGLSLAKPKA